MRRPRISTRFPYTTLFRSPGARALRAVGASASVPGRRRWDVDGGPGDLPAPARADRPRGARVAGRPPAGGDVALSDARSEEHTSELQSLRHLVCRLLLEKK